jgi:hypothetical protein
MQDPLNTPGCQHRSGRVSVFEEVRCGYTIENGRLTGEYEDDAEPEPTGEMTFSCDDCLVAAHYPNWRQAPDWILPYFRAAAKEYGLIEDDEKGD